MKITLNQLDAALFILIMICTGCMRSQTTNELRMELHEMKSKAPKATAAQLVQSGERAIEISDAASVASDLANDGVEQLSVNALEESLVFFEMALKKDRGNEKALFYLSLLRPFRPLRGLYFQFLPSDQQLVDFNVFVGDGFFHDDSPEYGLVRFLGTPTGEKIKNYREGVHKVIYPFLKELHTALSDFALLLTNSEIELSVTLPKDLAFLKDARVRNADIRMIRSFYLYMYIVTRMMVSYEVTSFPASDINLILPEARLKIDMADPAFGILSDPTVFQFLKDDTLELMGAVEKAAMDLKIRYAKRANSKDDLFQANIRQVLMCHKYQNLTEAINWAKSTQRMTAEVEAQVSPKESTAGGAGGASTTYPVDPNPSAATLSNSNPSAAANPSSPNTSNSNPPNPVCLYQETVTTPLMITTYGSSARRYFENSFDGQSVQRWEEVQRFQEIVANTAGPSSFEPVFKSIRDYLKGPVETKYSCLDSSGKKIEENIFVDFTSFAEHPVRDLKSLHPQFIGGTELNNIYQLSDPTVGGLFRPHLPCYKLNQEKAKLLMKTEIRK